MVKVDCFLGPTSYYPANGSTMTPPPTPSRTTVNGITHQPSTPFHQQQQQQQQQMSAPQPVYPPLFFPVQANVDHLTYLNFYFTSFI